MSIRYGPDRCGIVATIASYSFGLIVDGKVMPATSGDMLNAFRFVVRIE
jgi:hypothetical protein